jgi:hypothetical protein
MNKQPELGSTWKGRVLVNLRVFNADSPQREIGAIQPTLRERALKEKLLNFKHKFQV